MLLSFIAFFYRITPAGAGKTTIREFGLYSWEDHPRRCGENYVFTDIIENEDRITPAGAGKTTISKLRGTTTTDHPRRCGENGRQVGEEVPVCGITPAGAGKT